jgi:hypothetical protein
VNSGTEINSLILHLHHVDLGQVTYSSPLLADQLAKIVENTLALSRYAQSQWDSHGTDETAELCRQLVGICADIRMLTAELKVRKLARRKADILRSRVCIEYTLFKAATAKLGILVSGEDPYLGKVAEVLL